MDSGSGMVVFVAGVHGVGKTYLCERYAAQNEITHSSASALIRSELKSISWAPNKLVPDINSNQVALIKAVNKLTKNNANLLLDGHFVLKGSNGLLVEIDEDTFKGLSLSAIVLIEAFPETVRSRLASRDSNTDTEEVYTFLKAEKKRAIHISNLLNLPLTTLKQPSNKIFKEHIDSIFKPLEKEDN